MAATACAANVHLYEMYWADLSRLAGAVLRVVGEVYQVLLHLPTVGVHTLRAAQLEHPHDAKWKRFVGLQNFAVWLLQVPIALANLLLVALALAVAVGGLLAKLPWRGQCGLLCVGAIGVTIILLCTALYRSKARLPSIALIGLLGFTCRVSGGSVRLVCRGSGAGPRLGSRLGSGYREPRRDEHLWSAVTTAGVLARQCGGGG